MRLTNLAGQVIIQKNISVQDTSQFAEKLNLSALSSGIYILSITSEKGVYMKKIEKW